MAYNEVLAARVRALMPGKNVREQKMFGGLCFLVGGNMACGVHTERLMVRVGAERHADALEQPGAVPMDFTGRPMRGMVWVEPHALDDEGLATWVGRGVAYAKTLPAK